MNGIVKKDAIEEALKYAELKSKYPLGSNYSKKVFIIHKEWYKQWKQYVNYSQVIKKSIHSKSKNYHEENTKIINQPSFKKSDKPGKIFNQKLIYNLNEFLNDGDLNNPENIVVQHNTDQKRCIKFVNEEIWKMFKNLYGGGPEISTIIFEEKMRKSSQSKTYVEIFQGIYNICFLPKFFDLAENLIEKLSFKNTFFSKRRLLSDLKTKLIKIINNLKIYGNTKVNLENTRLWKLNSNNSYTDLQKILFKIYKSNKSQMDTEVVSYLEYADSKLENLPLADSDIILVEYFDSQSAQLFLKKKIEFKEELCPGCNDVIKKILMKPCVCKDVWYCSDECKDSCYFDHIEKCRKKGVEDDELKKTNNSRMGIVGLQNLSNTCFINTSLQCISNCWELTNYFLKNHHLKDINISNPIGTKGILAREFANLLKYMWYGNDSVISPWNFKRAIAKFQPMFEGYAQHDTQEFLNFLLDGLHEDLNRVINKPLVEKDESKKNDDIKSLTQWYGFLLRNQSIFVDLLYGQFKSILYCPNEKCQNISTTFDPFLSISLPLTNTTEPFEVMCFFIFYDIKILPIQLTIPFNNECSIMAFRNKIAKILNIHPFSFFIVKMDADASFDQIVSSTGLLKTNVVYSNVNQKPFFLFQINPELFYNEKLNKFYAKDKHKYQIRDFSNTFDYLEFNIEKNKYLFREDYDEDESGSTIEHSLCFYTKTSNDKSKLNSEFESIKVNTDDNHGFPSDYIQVMIYLQTYSTKDNQTPNIKNTERIIFPRILYININTTVESIHKIIFDYFEKVINKRKDKPLELWKSIFENKLDTCHANDTYEFHRNMKYPYRIRIRNINKKYNKPCVLCEQTGCIGCLLPYTDRLNLRDILIRYPKNSDGVRLDNTYFYLSESQRKLHKNWNRDFSLELIWLPEYRNEVYKLNNKVNHDFKLQSTELSNTISIYDCFKKFVKFEKLEEMNEWYCEQCKIHQKATKKMEIYRLPHIFIIHLKRFKDSNKICSLIDYPIVDLDLTDIVISNNQKLSLKYDLFGVANHIGTISSGHYYAYAKNPFTGLWYKFDDSCVIPVSQHEIVTENAYVLFYRRKNLENIIELEDIYRNKFINYKSMMDNVEATVKVMNDLSYLDFS